MGLTLAAKRSKGIQSTASDCSLAIPAYERVRYGLS